ncbi:MAG: hypothetical protein DRP09_17450, partial [Candidatus Thorarchaeota archaeon]
MGAIVQRLKDIVGLKNISGNQINPSTEETASDIKTAVEKIDNQEDSITYVTVQKTGTDGDIISAPGTGKKLRIHHIYVVNADDTDTAFKIRNGSGGSPYFAFYLAAYG